MVRACGALVLAGCCPALAEGRQNFLVRQNGARACCWCCRVMPVRQNDAAEPSLGAPEWCVCVHHQNAALPLRVSINEAPCSRLGGCTRYFFSLVYFCLFLALKDAFRSCLNCTPNMDCYISLESSECQLSNATGSTSIGRL